MCLTALSIGLMAGFMMGIALICYLEARNYCMFLCEKCSIKLLIPKTYSKNIVHNCIGDTNHSVVDIWVEKKE